MSKSITNFMKGEMGKMWVLWFLMSIGSGYFSFKGMSVGKENDFMALGGASVFAFCSGLAVFVFWHFAFKIVPFQRKLHDIIAAWLTVALGIIGIIL